MNDREWRATKVLICSINPKHKSGNIDKDPHAWDGWTTVPVVICPKCNRVEWDDEKKGKTGK